MAHGLACRVEELLDRTSSTSSSAHASRLASSRGSEVSGSARPPSHTGTAHTAAASAGGGAPAAAAAAATAAPRRRRESRSLSSASSSGGAAAYAAGDKLFGVLHTMVYHEEGVAYHKVRPRRKREHPCSVHCRATSSPPSGSLGLVARRGLAPRQGRATIERLQSSGVVRRPPAHAAVAPSRGQVCSWLRWWACARLPGWRSPRGRRWLACCWRRARRTCPCAWPSCTS